jgi:protease secretion system outer membrane protein
METEKRLKAGEATIDQLGLEIARQRQRQAEVFELQTRKELAEQALADLAGPNALIPNSFTLDNAVPDRLAQITRGEIFQTIEERNPELIAARFSEQAALLEREKRNADHSATVDIYATATRGENDTAVYIKDEMRLGVQLSLPLYTSGALTAAVSQADADYQKMKAITQATLARLKDRGNSAFGAVKSTTVKIDALNALIQAAELHAESIGRGVLAGVGSYGDLSRAEVELLEARRQRSNELLKFSQAWAALSVVTSRIDSIFERGLMLQPF